MGPFLTRSEGFQRMEDNNSSYDTVTRSYNFEQLWVGWIGKLHMHLVVSYGRNLLSVLTHAQFYTRDSLSSERSSLQI